jgi:hypothetical protein
LLAADRRRGVLHATRGIALALLQRLVAQLAELLLQAGDLGQLGVLALFDVGELRVTLRAGAIEALDARRDFLLLLHQLVRRLERALRVLLRALRLRLLEQLLGFPQPLQRLVRGRAGVLTAVGG